MNSINIELLSTYRSPNIRRKMPILIFSKPLTIEEEIYLNVTKKVAIAALGKKNTKRVRKSIKEKLKRLIYPQLI